jgi:hypothetical protein
VRQTTDDGRRTTDDGRHSPGRVFAIRRLIGQLTLPVALLLAGPLADFVFEPAMQPGGALAGSAGRLIGTGSGVRMALMIALVGVLGVSMSLSGYLFRAVRAAETAAARP